jgi:hypothetical protein
MERIDLFICHFLLYIFLEGVGCQQPLVPIPLLGPPFFPNILFLSTTLLAGMTGVSWHIQWPLNSQSHGSFLKEKQLFFS